MGRTAHGNVLQPSDIAAGPRGGNRRDCTIFWNLQRVAQRACTMISGGRAAARPVARALAQEEPQFIMLDQEPTASLDFGNQGGQVNA